MPNDQKHLDQIDSNEFIILIKELECISKFSLSDIPENGMKSFMKIIAGMDDIDDEFVSKFEPMISPSHDSEEYKYLSSLRSDLVSEQDIIIKEYTSPKIL